MRTIYPWTTDDKKKWDRGCEIEVGEIEVGEIEVGEIEVGEIEVGEIEVGEIREGGIGGGAGHISRHAVHCFGWL